MLVCTNCQCRCTWEDPRGKTGAAAAAVHGEFGVRCEEGVDVGGHLRIPGSFSILQVGAVHVAHHGGALTGLCLVGSHCNVRVQAEALPGGQDCHHGPVDCPPAHCKPRSPVRTVFYRCTRCRPVHQMFFAADCMHHGVRAAWRRQASCNACVLQSSNCAGRACRV